MAEYIVPGCVWHFLSPFCNCVTIPVNAWLTPLHVLALIFTFYATSVLFLETDSIACSFT